MHGLVKTLSAAVVGFAVGAGAATGVYSAVQPRHVAQDPPHAQAKAAAYAKIAAAAPATLPLGPETISDMVKQVSPAVVKVVATVKQQVSISSSPFFNPFYGSIFGNGPTTPQTEVQTDIGSGFFFNAKGYILTNDHVIQGASTIKVDVPGYRNALPATVVGSDYASDLAVLKVSLNKPAPTLPLGNSTATPVGAWAVAIGNPYNLSHTVTVGVISAKGRPLTIGSRHYRNLLQTSAPINPGNSGGPLLNLKGQVVGINTAVESQGQGIGFAIPTSTVERLLPQLMKGGPVTPWIGVEVATDSATIAQQYALPTSKGVIILAVSGGSPAAKGGLSAGDVITAVNGKPLTSAKVLQKIVRSAKIGKHLRLTVNDNGTQVLKVVTVGKEPQNQAPASSSSSSSQAVPGFPFGS